MGFGKSKGYTKKSQKRKRSGQNLKAEDGSKLVGRVAVHHFAEQERSPADIRRLRARSHDPITRNKPSLTEQQMRALIYGYWLEALDMPTEEEWHGQGGTIAHIVKQFGISKGSKRVVKRVLVRASAAFAGGYLYDPVRECGTGGDNVLIAQGSVEEQIVADAMEEGVGMTNTMYLVNEYRRHHNIMPHVGRSAVYTTVHRLHPLRTGIASGKQKGGIEWAAARMDWVTQLLLRFQHIKLEDLPADKRDKDCFKNLELGDGGADLLSTDQIVFWDETHKKLMIGGLAHAMGCGNGTEVRFKRNAAGKLDASGEYRDPKVQLKAKYTKETRLLVGVAAVKNADGTIEGKRCETWDYSGTWLDSITVFDAAVQKHLMEVKGRTAGSKGVFLTGRRTADEGCHANDLIWDPTYKIVHFRGVGKATAEKLAREGVKTISHLKHLQRAKIDAIAGKKLHGITKVKLLALRMAAQALVLHRGDYISKLKDHTLAADPYKSRYENDPTTTPEIELRKRMRTYGNGHTDIREAVTWMIEKSADVATRKDWKFYHDALSQLKDKKTKAWMSATKDKDGVPYINRWVLPVKGCNDDRPRYKGRPVGNSPELMPLDCSLFADVDRAAGFHINLTRHLKAGDAGFEKKFSRATPASSSSCYLRLLHPETGVAPSSERIIQDVTRCFDKHLRAIYEANGKCVPNLGSRNGHRRVAYVNNRGGFRVKGADQADHPIHADAQPAFKSLITKAEASVAAAAADT